MAESFGVGPKIPKSRVAGRWSCFSVDPNSASLSCLQIANRSASRQLGFLNLSCLVGKFLSFSLREMPVKASSFVRDTLIPYPNK